MRRVRADAANLYEPKMNPVRLAVKVDIAGKWRASAGVLRLGASAGGLGGGGGNPCHAGSAASPLQRQFSSSDLEEIAEASARGKW